MKKPTTQPKYAVGDVFGKGTIVEYLGVTHRVSRQKWQHQYRLQCECGNHFDRWQESLHQSVQRNESPSCGCSQTKRRRTVAEEPPSVPCIHNWGYKVKPINPYVGRR